MCYPNTKCKAAILTEHLENLRPNSLPSFPRNSLTVPAFVPREPVCTAEPEYVPHSPSEGLAAGSI